MTRLTMITNGLSSAPETSASIVASLAFIASHTWAMVASPGRMRPLSSRTCLTRAGVRMARKAARASLKTRRLYQSFHSWLIRVPAVKPGGGSGGTRSTTKGASLSEESLS